MLPSPPGALGAFPGQWLPNALLEENPRGEGGDAPAAMGDGSFIWARDARGGSSRVGRGLSRGNTRRSGTVGRGPEGTDEVPNLQRKGCRARQRTSFRIGVPITRGRDRARSRVVIRRARRVTFAGTAVVFFSTIGPIKTIEHGVAVFRFFVGVRSRARSVRHRHFSSVVASSHAPPRRCPRA